MALRLKFNYKIFLLIILLIIPYFIPSYFLNNFSLIQKLFFFIKHFEILFLILLYFLYNKTVKKEFLLIILFYIFLFFSCLINNISFTVYISNIINIIGPLLIIFTFFKKNSYEVIISFLTYFEVLIFINFLTLILYPKTGLYYITDYFTPDFYETYHYWFLGIDNLHVVYYFPAVILSFIYSVYNSKILSMRTLILLIIIGISAIISWSATTLVFLGLTIAFVLFRNLIKKIKLFNTFTYLIGILILNYSIIIFKVQNLFKYFIVDILKKDLTFTNRVYIWDDTINYILKSPFMGYGFESEFVRYLKGIKFHAFHAHNLLLEVLYLGGFISFSIFFIILFNTAFKLKKYDNDITMILSYFIFVFFCISLTEVYTLFLIFFIISIASFSSEIEKDILIRRRK